LRNLGSSFHRDPLDKVVWQNGITHCLNQTQHHWGGAAHWGSVTKARRAGEPVPCELRWEVVKLELRNFKSKLKQNNNNQKKLGRIVQKDSCFADCVPLSLTNELWVSRMILLLISSSPLCCLPCWPCHFVCTWEIIDLWLWLTDRVKRVQVNLGKAKTGSGRGNGGGLLV
jgi:hypothetical protein